MSGTTLVEGAVAIPVRGSDRPMLVDAEDAHLFAGVVLRLHPKGYAIRERTRRVCRVFAHILVFGQAPNGFVVDHRNGDRLDNRRSNLRLATLSQNAANQRRSVRSKSGYIGVSRSGVSSWSASIHVGRPRHLGSFTTAERAARARDRAAFEAWGEFATLNFPEEYRNDGQGETPALAGVEASEEQND